MANKFWALGQALAWVTWRDLELVERVGPNGREPFRSLIIKQVLFAKPVLSHDEYDVLFSIAPDARAAFVALSPEERAIWEKMYEVACSDSAGPAYKPDADYKRSIALPQVGEPVELLGMLQEGRLVAWGRYGAKARMEAIPDIEWTGCNHYPWRVAIADIKWVWPDGTLPQWRLSGWENVQLVKGEVMAAFPPRTSSFSHSAAPTPSLAPGETPAKATEHHLWPAMMTSAVHWRDRSPNIEPEALLGDLINLAKYLAEESRIDPTAFCLKDGVPFADSDQLIWHLWGARDKQFPVELQMRPGAFDEFFATEEGEKWLSERGLSESGPPTVPAPEEAPVEVTPERLAKKRGRRKGQGAIDDSQVVSRILVCVESGTTVHRACEMQTAGMSDKDAQAAIRRWTRKVNQALDNK